jgi:hypothetical protein
MAASHGIALTPFDEAGFWTSKQKLLQPAWGQRGQCTFASSLQRGWSPSVRGASWIWEHGISVGQARDALVMYHALC